MTGPGIQAALASIAALDAGRPRKSITILGGGLAGLVAAYELSQLGHKVTLYEASNRLGGRAWTHRFPNGQYHELGAMRVPESHDFTRHYVLDVCGLQLRPFVNHHDRTERSYYIRGVHTSHQDATGRLFPAFKLSQRERSLCSGPAGALHLMEALGTVVEEIRSSDADRAAIFLEGPMTARVADLERQTLGEFLRASLDTDEALELVGAVTSLEVWWHKAVTMFIRDDLNGAQRLHEIVGGTDTLPQKLAELLKDHVEIEMNTPIREIHNRGDSVQIVIEQAGTLVRRDAEIVICTLPFPVLRRMAIRGVSAAKAAAIRKLSYASAAKVLLSCKSRFWESSGVTGGGSQTDLINRQIYYPSDRVPGNATGAESGLKTVAAQARIRQESPEEQAEAAAISSPGVLIGSYCWGADARRLGALPAQEQIENVLKCVAEIHPEVTGQFEEGVAMVWNNYPWAGAAFSFLEPGDLENHYTNARQAEGRLHFAGEHCSLDQGWMQGAIESSLESLKAVVQLEAGAHD